MKQIDMIVPRICCVGRRRIVPSRDHDHVVLDLVLEHGDRDEPLAKLVLERGEATNLKKALTQLLRGRR